MTSPTRPIACKGWKWHADTEWICCRQHSLVTFSISSLLTFFLTSHSGLKIKKKCESRHAPHHVSRFKSASQSQFGSTEPWKEQISVSGNSFSDTRELWTGKRESFEFFSIRWMAVSFANCCVCSVVCCIRLFSRKATHELMNLTWTSSLRSKRVPQNLRAQGTDPSNHKNDPCTSGGDSGVQPKSQLLEEEALLSHALELTRFAFGQEVN